MSYVFGQYGQAAVNAARQLATNPNMSPAASWDGAISALTTSEESKKKCCPRGAFLGLCSQGVIKGAPTYPRPLPKGKGEPSATVPVPAEDKSGAYAITAYRILKANPSFANLPATMVWEIVLLATKQDPEKTHNAQMHVVLALWHSGLLQIG
jgi:hypothetical protein